MWQLIMDCHLRPREAHTVCFTYSTPHRFHFASTRCRARFHSLNFKFRTDIKIFCQDMPRKRNSTWRPPISVPVLTRHLFREDTMHNCDHSANLHHIRQSAAKLYSNLTCTLSYFSTPWGIPFSTYQPNLAKPKPTAKHKAFLRTA